MRLKGKVALITGAGSGMGRAAAILFAKEGAKVLINDFREETGKETLNIVRNAGGDAAFFLADVSKNDEVQKMIKFTMDTFGRLDVLYNNAAIEEGDGSVVDLPEENWDRIMAVNLKGVYLCCKYAIPEMIKGGGGSIINVSSVGAFIGSETLHAYGAAKGAILSLTRSLAVQFAPKNIRVNAIAPGAVDTPMLRRLGEGFMQMALQMTPMGRIAQPEELANVALFLASDESSFATGSTFIIDGGLLAC